MKCANCGEKIVSIAFCPACRWMAPPKVLAIRGFRHISLGVLLFVTLFLATALSPVERGSISGLFWMIWGADGLLFVAVGIAWLREARSDAARLSQSKIASSNWFRVLSLLCCIVLAVAAVGALSDRDTYTVAFVIGLGSIIAMTMYEKSEVRKTAKEVQPG